jgi:signal recognition particle receptor subunit beta
MAHLNVQERRVETKIAYVGPAQSGKTTNLEQLEKHEGSTALERTAEHVSLSYRSREDGAARFRDCDVMVNVVAPRTSFCSLTPEAAESMFRDVDGVVLVLDATPAARETNKTAAQLVRGAVAAAAASPSGARRVAVVVQVNKSDLPDAVGAADIAADLATDVGESWPMVAATATRGEGVLETIERTVADVVDVLRGEASTHETTHAAHGVANGAAPAHHDGSAREPAARSGRVEGNPLLHALRQLLRDTVSEKVHELEVELTRNLTDSFARAMKTAVAEAMSDAMTVAMADMNAKVASVRATQAEERERALTTAAAAAGAHQETRALNEATKRAVVEVRTFVGGVLQEVTRSLAVQTADVAEIQGNLAMMSAKLEGLASKEEMGEQRAEMNRVLDKSAREGREHLVTVIAGVRRSLDSLANDARTFDTRRQVEETTQAVRALDKQLALLDSQLRGARDDAREGAVQAVASLASLSRIGDTTTDVQTQLNWLVDQLKNKKKGWFA